MEQIHSIMFVPSPSLLPLFEYVCSMSVGGSDYVCSISPRFREIFRRSTYLGRCDGKLRTRLCVFAIFSDQPGHKYNFALFCRKRGVWHQNCAQTQHGFSFSFTSFGRCLCRAQQARRPAPCASAHRKRVWAPAQAIFDAYGAGRRAGRPAAARGSGSGAVDQRANSQGDRPHPLAHQPRASPTR